MNAINMKRFLEILRPVEKKQHGEWKRIVRESEVGKSFWYPSAGYDFGMLPYLGRNDIPVGFFLLSDYYNRQDGKGYEALYERYFEFGSKGIDVEYTDVRIKQMIALRLWDKAAIKTLNKKYADRVHTYMAPTAIPAKGAHFYYVHLQIDEREFFGLLSSVENSVLLEEAVVKYKLMFDTICTKQDGCRKGGAVYCLNNSNGPFLGRVLRECDIAPNIWVTDHFHGDGGADQNVFRLIKRLGSGGYGPLRAYRMYTGYDDEASRAC